jgi:(p)ppGpp synthase/HD superfamily hydrolase
MIYTPLTIKAMQFAEKAHRGQVDKAGVPYIFHCYEVAQNHEDEIITTVALLHDVIEDADRTKEDLLSEGFPLEVVTAIDLLTKREGQPYEEYINGIKNNSIAKAVKLADLENNSRKDRLKLLDKKTANKLCEKYEKALNQLRN